MIRVLALVRGGGALRCAVALGPTTAVAAAASDDAIFARARAAGATRLVAIDGGLDDTDYLGAAQVLASAARKLGFDVVVCGPGRRGAVGPAVAERLGVPHLTEVVEARLDGERVVVRRREAGGLRSYSAVPPFVLCAADEPPAEASSAAATPAAPEIEHLTLAQIGVLPAELGWRRRFLPRSAAGPIARPLLFADVSALAQRLEAEGLLWRPADPPLTPATAITVPGNPPPPSTRSGGDVG